MYNLPHLCPIMLETFRPTQYTHHQIQVGQKIHTPAPVLEAQQVQDPARRFLKLAIPAKLQRLADLTTSTKSLSAGIKVLRCSSIRDQHRRSQRAEGRDHPNFSCSLPSLFIRALLSLLSIPQSS
jgi:hypothetical protein